MGDDLARSGSPSRRAPRCGRSCSRGCASRRGYSSKPSALGERGRRLRCVGRDGRGPDPLLGDLLQPDVERGRDPKAALPRAASQVGVSAPQILRASSSWTAHTKCGRHPARGRLWRQLDRLALLGLEIGVGDRAVRHRHPAVGHQLEHRVATLGDLGVRLEDEVARPWRPGTPRLRRGPRRSVDRVAHEVVVGRATAAAPRGSPPRPASGPSSDLPKYDCAAAFTP